jgi:hypothetical protein
MDYGAKYGEPRISKQAFQTSLSDLLDSGATLRGELSKIMCCTRRKRGDISRAVFVRHSRFPQPFFALGPARSNFERRPQANVIYTAADRGVGLRVVRMEDDE